MRPSIHDIFLVWLTLLACGCATSRDRLVLEQELHRQEVQIRDLRSKVTATEDLLADQDRELQVLRQSAGRPSGAGAGGRIATVALKTESQAAWASVAGLKIHRLTCGMLRDGNGSAQVLNVVLQPVDPDGELVKVAGTLTVAASDVSATGTPDQLLKRSFSITDSRGLWTRGLISSGFHVHIQLTDAEAAAVRDISELLISATLELDPQRTYSTSELIDVSQ